MRTLTIFAALALAAPPAFAQDAGQPKVVILDYGLYSDRRVEVVEAPETPTGEWYYVDADSIRLLEETDRVSAELGVTMGVRYYVSTLKPGEQMTVSVRIEHPSIVNPEGRSFTVQVGDGEAGDKQDPGYHAYTFDYDWECVLGPWSFTISAPGAEPASVTFDVFEENCRPPGLV